MRVPVARWAGSLLAAVRAHRPGRRAWFALVVLLLVGAATVGGLTKLTTDTSPESFLPRGEAALAGLADAAKSFGGDPIVVLLESQADRQLLGADQLSALLALEGKLAKAPDVATVYGPATVLNQIAGSAQNMLASLSGHRDRAAAEATAAAKKAGESRAEIDQATEEAVARFDKRYGSLLVQGLPAGLPTLHNPRFIDQVIFTEGGAPKSQWRFVVPAADVVSILIRPRESIDQSATERLVHLVREEVAAAGLRTNRVTVTGVPAVTAGLSAQVRREAPMIGALAVVLIAACYLFVPWHAERRRRLLPLAVTLAAIVGVLAAFGWLGKPLTLGLVAFLPILLGIASDFPAYLAHPGQRRRVIVCALASATAFASLALSPLPFVADLGLALAAGQLCALGLAYLLRHRLRRSSASQDDAGPGPRTARLSPVRRAGLALVSGALAATGWLALSGLAVEARPDRLAAGLSVIDDALHAERVLGAAGEVQVLVRSDNVLSPQAWQWMRAAQEKIVVAHGDELRPIVSPPSVFAFLGESPTPAQIRAGYRQVPEYLAGAVIRSDMHRAVLSFQFGLHDLAEQKALFDDVRANLPESPKGLEAEVVGLPVVAARGHELISGSRLWPNLAAIAGAGLVLLIGLRERRDALRAVLAAALATGWGLAGASIAGLSLTPLTIVVGSLTTAIACEFTVMLARTGQGSRMRWTVVAAAVAAAVGYLALLASSLTVLAEFGLVLAATVLLSLAAAHVVLRMLPPRGEFDRDRVEPRSLEVPNCQEVTVP